MPGSLRLAHWTWSIMCHSILHTALDIKPQATAAAGVLR